MAAGLLLNVSTFQPCAPAAPASLSLKSEGTGEGGATPTFWMSVMSASLMTLFLLEDPDLELSKHK